MTSGSPTAGSPAAGSSAVGTALRSQLEGWRHPGEGSLNRGLLASLVVVFVALSLWSPYFLTSTNLLNIGKAVAIVGIAAVGETIVIISGGFDLSIGSVMAASGMVSAFLVGFGVPLPLAFACSIALGLFIGVTNGAIISYARINPLITTLATLAIVRGLGYVVSGGKEIVDHRHDLARAGYRIPVRHPVHGADPGDRVPGVRPDRCPVRDTADTRTPSVPTPEHHASRASPSIAGESRST